MGESKRVKKAKKGESGLFKKLTNYLEYDNHSVVSFINDEKSGLRGFIVIHRGSKDYPSFGATRCWKYNSDGDALRDALRLSRAMSYKSALAGLKYGGAKAVIIANSKSPRNKNGLLKTYAQKVNSLGGRFITGTDVGITDADVRFMKKTSKYFVGTKSDPARFTATGVFYAIAVCLNEVFGKDSFGERTFAIQGVGKTGSELLKLIYPKSKKVFIADVDRDKLKKVKKEFPDVKVVSPAKIDKIEVDVFSPCALNHCINYKNIKALKCKIIAGSANNQLEEDSLGEKLFKRGIVYAPDNVVNAGGLISVVDEYEKGGFQIRRTTKRVKKIEGRLLKVLTESKRRKKATNYVANKMAEKKFIAMN